MRTLEVETIAQRLTLEANSSSEREMLTRWFDDGGETARQSAWDELAGRSLPRQRRYVW